MNAILLLFKAFPRELRLFPQVRQFVRYSSVSRYIHAPHVAGKYCKYSGLGARDIRSHCAVPGNL